MTQVTARAKSLLKMLLNDRPVQIFDDIQSKWDDFDGSKHGKLIFGTEEYRYRVKPSAVSYFYARFDDGSRADMQDSLSKAEVLAESMDKGDFIIEKIDHDLSFEYKPKSESSFNLS